MSRELTADAAIIGAGAAGLLCAGTAARRGRRIVLIERNSRPARKLMITGKGRCNVTNHCTAEELIRNTRHNGKFLYSAASAFPPEETIRLFEGLGVPLKTERGGRVFPVSDKACDVVDALVGYAKAPGVTMLFQRAGEILTKNGAVCGVRCENTVVRAPRVVIATGGLSYPLTGSDGDGYRFARELGHTIVPTRPSLVPLITEEGWCRDLMGLALKNVAVSLIKKQNGKVLFREIGEMLFTHFGVSGPLILTISSLMEGDPAQYEISIDLKPGLDPAQLDARLVRDFDQNLNKDFLNSLGALLPRRLVPVAVRLSGIAGDRKVNQITREERTAFARLLKGLVLHPVGFRPVEEAIVTAGGVSTKEVDPRTMQSKLVPGLFFAGEVLDLDGYTGGYNLQIAFCTGYLAAQNL